MTDFIPDPPRTARDWYAEINGGAPSRQPYRGRPNGEEPTEEENTPREET
ncbi:MAG: hypothetical protein IKN53_00355 [Oscillibacter sp.]|nr:hypothetical protein [Oscillibacter sp.]